MICSSSSKSAAFTATLMIILFHFQSRDYLTCYQICSRIAIMPLSGLTAMAWKLIRLNSCLWCYLLSSSSLTPVELLLDSSTYITSQDSVKVLGIITDKQLTFNEHNSLCYTKAARKLNAFARISKYLNSRCTIHHSFIVSNFSYCPLVWHFCGKTNNAKTRKDPRTIAAYHVEWLYFIIRGPIT